MFFLSRNFVPALTPSEFIMCKYPLQDLLQRSRGNCTSEILTVCQDNIIGIISGRNSKRLSLQLVNTDDEPNILILSFQPFMGLC